MFIFGARSFHSRRTRNEKSVPKNSARKMENGADLWRRFLERGAFLGLSSPM